MKNKKSLGRGLSALIPETDNEKDIQNIEIKSIYPNKNQPRKNFDEESLKLLVESIKTYGVLQPVILNKDEQDKFMIIAGERRYRASIKAGLEVIPAIVKEISMREVMEIALIENLQRENLSPVEEGIGYKTLQETYNLTHEEISKVLGKSRSHISNMLRLLNLHSEILDLINDKKLSAGHGKVILFFDDKEKQLEVAKTVIEKNLSVKETEKLIHSIKNEKNKNTSKKEKDIFIIDIEEKLRNILGSNVKILNGKKKGKIEIEYYSDEELNDIVSMFIN